MGTFVLFYGDFSELVPVTVFRPESRMHELKVGSGEFDSALGPLVIRSRLDDT